MRLYLDVDGTLLRRSGHARLRGDLAPANHLLRFLEWASGNFECVWLTSRTRHGSDDRLLPVLRQAVGPGEEWDRIKALIAAFATPVWEDHKAQAIALDLDFCWIDDAPEEESLHALAQAGRQDCWISVAVDQDPDDLRKVMEQIITRQQHRHAAE